jgi:hypothetical protein
LHFSAADATRFMPRDTFARPFRLALVVTITVLGTIIAAPLDAGAPLSMTVAPYLGFAPADLRVRLDIVRRPQNRTLVVVAESDEFYRSSEMPLEAEEAPRMVMVEFRGLPGGEYAVSGEVRDADGRTLAVVHQEVRVLSRAGSQ